jgi:hypothetical protein
MGIRAQRFNTYLLLAALVALTGCQTESRLRKRQVTVLGVHLEARADAGERTAPISVFRENPLVLNVQKEPFLNESMVVSANVIENPGGFAISVQFDDHGQRLLEMYSAQNPGKHIVITCQFGKKLEHKRNLAAPIIPRRIGNGALMFTPDADRAEADDIVYGLNNLAAKTKAGQD